MSDQQYLTIKDQLDNPQRIVLVNRVGGPKEPKIPKWFEPYKQQFDSLSKQFDSLNQQFDSFRQQTEKRFEKIENRLNNIESKLDDTKMPEWFKQ
ncbi:MAG: hypothetical protein MJ219_00665 [Mycoplasmoidaceae bacterium]|nr:hypothetical protein [Mycoplasmoidaceae bacterium]